MIRRVVEIMDHAPAALGQAEVLLLCAMAELAKADEWDIPMSALTRRTRLSASGVRKIVQRLAAAGIDVRVPIGKDRHTRPLYAVPGVVPRWRIPTFPPPPGCDCRACEKAQVSKGGTVVPPSDPDTSTEPDNGQVTEGGTSVPPPNEGGTRVPAGGTGGLPAGTVVPPKPLSVKPSRTRTRASPARRDSEPPAVRCRRCGFKTDQPAHQSICKPEGENRS